ncbi:hypothetical protein JOE49_002931 [Paenibacillus sp. PvR133]|uniref:hypothetical protein n=1 Tax=Paenibacillus sp. PvR133 TaxID=2806598 RepID=UPI001AE30433|nr:hypothetical protein [Paenibacillus sp. PvR133]MBP1175679.1 hypothetical protein [Paenibacillus sp. PvR133]
MPQIKAVQTPIGALYGRDAIYLDHVHMNYSKKELVLKGEINGGLAVEATDGFVPYELIFTEVYYFNMIELDVALHLSDREYTQGSSFDELTDTPLLATIASARGKNLKHLMLKTYDDIVEIACGDYKMTI